MSYLDTQSILANYSDGDDCTEMFDILRDELIPISWLSQTSGNDVRLLLHTVLKTDCVPCEGSCGDSCSIDFWTEIEKLGFTMTYIFDNMTEDMGFAYMYDIHVYRNSAWDQDVDKEFMPFEIEFHDE